jgi:hypothetical protein
MAKSQFALVATAPRGSKCRTWPYHELIGANYFPRK